MSGGISEVESGPVDVSLNITGTLDRITPTISSDPPASDITLFSLLGLGAFAGSAAGGDTNGSPFTSSSVKNSILAQSINFLVRPGQPATVIRRYVPR